MKKINLYIIIFISIITLSIFDIQNIYAVNMSSQNFYIINDSINFGGTENSVSNDYIVSDTLGEIATGFSSSTNYSTFSGYRTLQSSYISISSSPDMAMPDMNGMGGEDSLGSTAWKVITDNIAGYEIYIKTNISPALRDPVTSAFFDDYSPSTANPDYFFTVPTNQSVFGFSVEGQDIDTRFKDNGSDCGIGNFDTADRCWDGLSTTDKIIAKSLVSNHPGGIITTVKYKAGVGSNKIQDSGAYTTSVTVTAITL